MGSEQRTCALRAGPEGARVRFVGRQALTELHGAQRPSTPTVAVMSQLAPRLQEKVLDEEAEQPEAGFAGMENVCGLTLLVRPWLLVGSRRRTSHAATVDERGKETSDCGLSLLLSAA